MCCEGFGCIRSTGSGRMGVRKLSGGRQATFFQNFLRISIPLVGLRQNFVNKCTPGKYMTFEEKIEIEKQIWSESD
jgi:hypothetical protein